MSVEVVPTLWSRPFRREEASTKPVPTRLAARPTILPPQHLRHALTSVSRGTDHESEESWCSGENSRKLPVHG